GCHPFQGGRGNDLKIGPLALLKAKIQAHLAVAHGKDTPTRAGSIGAAGQSCYREGAVNDPTFSPAGSAGPPAPTPGPRGLPHKNGPAGPRATSPGAEERPAGTCVPPAAFGLYGLPIGRRRPEVLPYRVL